MFADKKTFIMITKDSTDKEIAIATYKEARKTAKNSERTARNAILIGWMAIGALCAYVFLAIYN